MGLILIVVYREFVTFLPQYISIFSLVRSDIRVGISLQREPLASICKQLINAVYE